MTFADRVPRYLRFSQYWGTFFIFIFIICCICNYFISSVPRYFILSNFRGTFFVYTYNMRLNFYSFLWLCTPNFHNFKMSGYARPNFSLFYTTYSLYSSKTYPEHTVYVIYNCTPLYTFSCFLGYTFSNYRCFCTTYSLYLLKMYPDVSSFHFLRYAYPNHHSFHITNT